MRTPFPGGAALLVCLLLGAGCGGGGGEEAAPRRPQAPVALVPQGSEVRALTLFSNGAVVFHRELQQDELSGTGAAFPLVAYRHFCEGIRPEAFGLDQPRLRAVIRQPGGEPSELLVGSANFTRGGTYVAEPGSPCVYLVTASDIHRLAGSAGEELAAPFAPPPKPQGAPEEGDEDQRIDPWVEQANRHGGG